MKQRKERRKKNLFPRSLSVLLRGRGKRKEEGKKTFSSRLFLWSRIRRWSDRSSSIFSLFSLSFSILYLLSFLFLSTRRAISDRGPFFTLRSETHFSLCLCHQETSQGQRELSLSFVFSAQLLTRFGRFPLILFSSSHFCCSVTEKKSFSCSFSSFV